ncbi:hypothetical protein ACTXG6_33555 [Pseudonocardia sp. Cha107L01]|uniref:hypothetical protein n=1 Tax=Pseudonocardia sp. Cha107L01 TaxID=3457576 RepID=UPI00403EA84C
MKNVLTLVSVAVVLVFSLAGCGSKSASSPNNSSKSSSSASASAKNCAAGYTAATINGQAKCLQPGQECQQAQASSYKQYGFTCTKVNNRYVLQKK